MPTGYTAELVEDGQEFADFVLRCSRAFLVHMREESITAPIRNPKISPYHSEELVKAEAEIARLSKMTTSQQRVFGRKVQKENIKRYKECLKQNKAENSRITKMAGKVSRWSPPTEKHKSLKDFMLEQLKTSLNDDSWTERSIAEAKKISSAGYYTAALESAREDIQYHTQQLEEEKQRVLQTSEWIEQLKRSLEAM